MSKKGIIALVCVIVDTAGFVIFVAKNNPSFGVFLEPGRHLLGYE